MIVVFWLEDCSPHCTSFHDDLGLPAVLKFVEEKRKTDGVRHVVISSEMTESVGKPGVTSVEEGKLPDGQPYLWTKAHRGAGPVAPEDKPTFKYHG